MIDITYKVTKKPKLGERGIEIIKRQYTDMLSERLKNVICPDHHQRPRVIVSIYPESDPTIKIEGCCQKIVDEATQALK